MTPSPRPHHPRPRNTPLPSASLSPTFFRRLPSDRRPPEQKPSSGRHATTAFRSPAFRRSSLFTARTQPVVPPMYPSGTAARPDRCRRETAGNDMQRTRRKRTTQQPALPVPIRQAVRKGKTSPDDGCSPAAANGTCGFLPAVNVRQKIFRIVPTRRATDGRSRRACPCRP